MADKHWSEIFKDVLLPVIAAIAAAVAWQVNERETQTTEYLGYVHDLTNEQDGPKQTIAYEMLTELESNQSVLIWFNGKYALKTQVAVMVCAIAKSGEDTYSWRNAAKSVLSSVPKGILNETSCAPPALASSGSLAPSDSTNGEMTKLLAAPVVFGSTVYIQYGDPSEKPFANLLRTFLNILRLCENPPPTCHRWWDGFLLAA
jgi:hypothetical protein